MEIKKDEVYMESNWIRRKLIVADLLGKIGILYKFCLHKLHTLGNNRNV